MFRNNHSLVPIYYEDGSINFMNVIIELVRFELTWIKSMQIFFQYTNAIIESDNFQIPPLQQEGNAYLIDGIIDSEKFLSINKKGSIFVVCI